jgi:hypothetical protein
MTLHDDMMVAAGLPSNEHAHGESVTYHLSGEDDVVFTGVFVPDRSDLVDAIPGGRDDTRTGSLTVAKTALASPSRDATLTIRSEKWAVTTYDDGGAFWILNLKRSVGIERANEPFRTPSM